MQNNILKTNNANTKLNPPLKPLQLRNNLHLHSIWSAQSKCRYT